MAESNLAVLDTGDEAPEFELEGTDGQTYTLDSFSDNEALLVVFTCNHCPYAVAKMPLLNDLASSYDEVAVVGINPNNHPDYEEDSFEKMQVYVEQGDINYDAYLWDPTQTVAAAYGATCTPDPFLFERANGAFHLRYHGRLDDAMNPDDEPTRNEIRDIIEAVLADEPIPYDPTPSRGCSIKWQDGNEPDYW